MVFLILPGTDCNDYCLYKFTDYVLLILTLFINNRPNTTLKLFIFFNNFHHVKPDCALTVNVI